MYNDNPKPIVLVSLKIQDNNKNIRDQAQESLERAWPDYHVLIVPAEDQKEVVKLEVFYKKDWTKIQIESLKTKIELRLLELKNKS